MKEKEKVGISETPNPGSEKHEVESWLRTINKTVQWRDEIGVKMGWKRFIQEYKGDWKWLQSSVSIPLSVINLVFAYVKTEIARLYFKDPWITVNAKRIEDLGAAQIAEQIVNYIWNEIKLKSQMKMVLLEALLVGHSWIKLGYSAEFGTVESQPKEDLKKGPGRPKKIEVETNEYIKSENVFAYHVSYKDIIFDPSATYPCTHNARWMAQKLVKPYRAVCESGIYENTDDLKPNVYIDDPNAQYDTADSVKEAHGKDVRSVVLWEIYDLDNQVITTVSPGCKKKLREIPLPEYLNGGFPFVMFGFNPVPGDVYPMSDIAAHEPQIIQLIKILSIEDNHLKRWNRQMIVDADTFTEAEMSKFKDAIDGAIITSQGGNAKDKVFVPPYAPVQSDVYSIWNQVYDVWRSVAGQTQSEQGGNAKTQTRTLGELRMQLQGGKARSDEKVDVFEDSIAEVARKLLSIIQKKYTLPKIARIVGDKAVQQKILKSLQQRPSAQPQVNGQPNPVQQQSFQSEQGFSWNKEDIMGDMDVDVLAGSTVPMDRESQLQIMEKMIPLLSSAGITPGSPAAKAYAREFMRLVGIMSLESVMDIADQQPPQPPPKVMETQAKLQAKMAETKQKIEGKQKEEAIKLEAMKQKLEVDKVKNQMDMQKGIAQTILEQIRHASMPVNGANNGHAG